MRALGIDWKAPARDDWTLIWGGAALGFGVGLAIHSVTRGNPNFVLGMGAAGAVATGLIVSGANMNSGGWQGPMVALCGALAAFLGISVLTIG